MHAEMRPHSRENLADLPGIREALCIPRRQELCLVISPGRRRQKQYAVNRNLLAAEFRDEFRRLCRRVRGGLLKPDAHRPERGLTGAARQLRELVQHFAGIADEQEKIQHLARDGDQVLARRRRADIMLDLSQRTDVYTPAHGAPGERQRAVCAIVGINDLDATIQITSRLAKAVNSFAAFEFEPDCPDVMRKVGSAARQREHGLAGALQGQAKRV